MKPSSLAAKPAPIHLNIQGLGEVPSFKNSKEIGKLRNGKTILRTNDAKAEWMNRAIACIAFQSRSELQTRGIAIRMEPLPPLLTASLLPLDDSRKWIGEICVNWQQVSRGEEGANITVERIK